MKTTGLLTRNDAARELNCSTKAVRHILASYNVGPMRYGKGTEYYNESRVRSVAALVMIAGD